jgi:hypothetical protein
MVDAPKELVQFFAGTDPLLELVLHSAAKFPPNLRPLYRSSRQIFYARRRRRSQNKHRLHLQSKIKAKLDVSFIMVRIGVPNAAVDSNFVGVGVFKRDCSSVVVRRHRCIDIFTSSFTLTDFSSLSLSTHSRSSA